jgi:hypothetical protein
VYETSVCKVLWGVFVVCRRCFELARSIFESAKPFSKRLQTAGLSDSLSKMRNFEDMSVYEARVCLVLWGVFVVCGRCFELAR